LPKEKNYGGFICFTNAHTHTQTHTQTQSQDCLKVKGITSFTVTGLPLFKKTEEPKNIERDNWDSELDANIETLNIISQPLQIFARTPVMVGFVILVFSFGI
jgi:hypothetical protein